MFTGIIQAIAEVEAVKSLAQEKEVVFKLLKPDEVVNEFLSDIKIGDSIAVNGACLTVTEKTLDSFKVFISEETLKLTNLYYLELKSLVNLEKSLKLSSSLDGHLVSGHVDGIGEVLDKQVNKNHSIYKISYPNSLDKFFVHKGSVAINGVSLTINSISNNSLNILLIPHTLNMTNLAYLAKSDKVNLEVDMIARYIVKNIDVRKGQ